MRKKDVIVRINDQREGRARMRDLHGWKEGPVKIR